MSEEPGSRDEARAVPSSYDDPHSDARSSLTQAAGPESRDPVHELETEQPSDNAGEPDPEPS